MSKSFIANTAVGYPEEGIGVPPLFPVNKAVVINGWINVNIDITDSGGDGFDDSWETSHKPKKG